MTTAIVLFSGDFARATRRLRTLVANWADPKRDRQPKEPGNDRVGKRARIVAGLFKDIITQENNQKLIIPDKPAVRLFIRPELKRDEPDLVKILPCAPIKLI
jgi:hypothetical protein